MTTFKRICIKDWEITAENGDHCELKRGKEYITSQETSDHNVIVFTNFWVTAPIDIFAGAILFTE